MLITEQALITDSLIMRKILDALTILTTVLVLGILGGGFFYIQICKQRTV